MLKPIPAMAHLRWHTSNRLIDSSGLRQDGKLAWCRVHGKGRWVARGEGTPIDISSSIMSISSTIIIIIIGAIIICLIIA